MAAYEFSRLSNIDFEELAHDLLEASWHVKLEAFATGPDSGIDLRHMAGDGDTIVQCKHFVGSGFAKLLSHLKLEELPKIQVLAPRRYVLVTSVALTPANKEKIAAALAPFITTPADIIGATEVEALLREHDQVEKTHFKLWLTSTAVLQRVLHSAEQCQTDFRVDQIRKKLPLYVQNDAYPRALQILKDGRVVVISGQGGIGKSTLAELLIYAHLEEGYEPVVIQSDVREGRKVYRPERRQLFYFDDFLGQTYLGDRPEFLGRNQDSSLADFIAMIQGSENARFILTTREHILGSALQHSEKLAQSGLVDQRCVIELADYHQSHKARILYNHLYFSDLPAAYKAEIVKDDFFLEVINHENFNPRLIEWLASHTRMKQVTPADYQAQVRKLLDEPELIWSHAFERQISNSARHLLIALYATAWHCDLIDVEPVWKALHEYAAKKYNFQSGPNDFRIALKELDGAFITIQDSSVRFLNPSVRDFMAIVFMQSRERVHDTMAAAIRFKQLSSLWVLGSAKRYGSLRKHLTSEPEALLAALKRLLNTNSSRYRVVDGKYEVTTIDEWIEPRLRMLIEVAEALQSEAAVELLKFAISERTPTGSEPLNLARQLQKSPWLMAKGGGAIIRRTLLDLAVQTSEYARSWEWPTLLESLKEDSFWTTKDKTQIAAAMHDYCKEGAARERADLETVGDFENMLDYLESIQRRFGFDLRSEISALEEKIGELAGESKPETGTAFSQKDMEEIADALDPQSLRGIFATLLA